MAPVRTPRRSWLKQTFAPAARQQSSPLFWTARSVVATLPAVQKVLRFFVWVAIVLGAAVGILRATALRWWRIPANDPELSASLAPSLAGGDLVILWRLTKPGLGSLVTCPDPDDPTAVVMGRIAAVQGNVVSLLGDEVKINGVAPQVEYNCTDLKLNVINPDTLKPVELACDMEDIGGRLHERAHGKPENIPRPFQKAVGTGQIFLLSDNRVHPFDSRHFGTLPVDSCRESVVFRLVSEKGFFDVDSRLDYIR